VRAVVAALLLLSGATCGQDSSPLRLDGRIELANVDGRIDHLSADVKGRRLFVSALGNHTVEAIDEAAGKRTATLRDLPEPQGVYYDATTDRLFVACAADGGIRVFDGHSFQLLHKEKTSGDADNVRYDARSRRVMVGYGDGALAFLDAGGNRTGEIALDAHPESFRMEEAGGRVFVNVPDRKEIQVADVATRALLGRWPVTSALKNYPMALDEAHHRLLVGCRAPARMLAIDTVSGKETASVETVGDTDDLFYDARKSLVYVIGGQGLVDVLRQRDADHYERIGRYPTAPGARTGLFVPEWGKLFVAVPRRGEQRAEVMVFEAR